MEEEVKQNVLVSERFNSQNVDDTDTTKELKRYINSQNNKASTYQTVIDNESINKFNSSILKDKNWGSEDIIQSKQIDFNKPKKGNILRELGMSIVMTKLPRSRKYNTSKYNMIKED